MSRKSWFSVFHYGMVIALLSFCALTFSMGIRATFGAFVTPWENDLAATRVFVSLISFLSMLVYGAGIAVAGKLTDRFGPRIVLTASMFVMGGSLVLSSFSQSLWQIALLYGIFASLGFGGASNVTVSVAIVQWFREKRGLVIGFVIVGMAVGSIVVVPLTILLIEMFGWRRALLYLGAVILLILTPLYGIFYRNAPRGKEQGEKPAAKREAAVRNEARGKGGVSFFRLPVTWFIIIVYFICGFTDIGLIHTHLIPLAQGKGFAETTLATMMVFYGVTNVLGAIAIGYCTDRMQAAKLLSGLFALRALALLVLFAAKDSAYLYLFGLLYGLTDISTVAPFTALCVKVYGPQQIGSVFGTISFFHQFGAGVGSFVPGLLFDMTGNYDSTLLVVGALLVFGIALFVAIQRQLSAQVENGPSSSPVSS
ncbi:MFS transporter [Bacillaceae bacterium]